MSTSNFFKVFFKNVLLLILPVKKCTNGERNVVITYWGSPGCPDPRVRIVRRALLCLRLDMMYLISINKCTFSYNAVAGEVL